jgi:hypothetical protein
MASSRREEMLERHRHEERQQLMQLGIGVLHSFASAFTGTPLPLDPSILLPASAPSRLTPESDNGSSSGSEISFDMGGGKTFAQKQEEWKKKCETHIRKKKKEQKRKARRDAPDITFLDSDEEDRDDDDDSKQRKERSEV